MPTTQAPKIVVDLNETDSFVVDPSFFTRPLSGYAGTGIDTKIAEALKTYNPDQQIFFVYLDETGSEPIADIDVCDRTELNEEICEAIDCASVLVPKAGM